MLINPGSSNISLPGHQKIFFRLIGCAGIFGKFGDTLTVTVAPLRHREGESRLLTAKIPIAAQAFGCPIEFLAAKKATDNLISDDCLKLMETDIEFFESLLSSLSARETTIYLGVVSYTTEAKKREVKLRNNSAFSKRNALELNGQFI